MSEEEGSHEAPSRMTSAELNVLVKKQMVKSGEVRAENQALRNEMD